MTEKRAITAIGDSKLESFIASALIRLGWQVIHRALSFADLEKLLGESEESDVVLFDASTVRDGINKAVLADRPAELAYLQALAHRLKLPDDLVAHLNRQIEIS
jgi:uncharacterized membrane protein YebE (DUF533 family)